MSSMRMYELNPPPRPVPDADGPYREIYSSKSSGRGSRRSPSGPWSRRRICCTYISSVSYGTTNLRRRETASKIVNEYLARVGGREALMEAWREKKAAAKKGKKRSRASDANGSSNGVAKRGRKSSTHPATETPPASAKKAEFKPPSGSWEEEVTGIDACEGAEGNVIVYLTWKGGHKSQHPLSQIYKRCPQRVSKLSTSS
jgi:hypothetical protein